MTHKILPSKSISRLEILNYIVNFCTHSNYGTGKCAVFDVDNMFKSAPFDEGTPIGSLCKLTAAPNTKWYLCWLISIDKKDNGYHTYVMESIEDGSLCNWTNVGILHLPLSLTNRFPEWRWTDKQWEFKKRWFNACRKRSSYITIPKYPLFTEDGGVILTTRIRYANVIQQEPEQPSKKFDNWKKLTQKELMEFFDESVNASVSKIA